MVGALWKSAGARDDKYDKGVAMSPFDGFCEAKELDQEVSDWFADFCTERTGYKPHILGLEILEDLYGEFQFRAQVANAFTQVAVSV